MAVRAGGITDPGSRLRSLMVIEERRFRRAFLEAVAELESSATLDRIIELLEEGRTQEALSTIDEPIEALSEAIEESFIAVAERAARWLTTNALTVAVQFDVTNTAAVEAIQRNTLRVIREFTREQRLATRQALSRAITEGLGPRDAARMFRRSIGLTAFQERAVSNYRRLLQGGQNGQALSGALDRALRDRRFDRTVERSVRSFVPLDDEQIDRMVDRYRQRYIRYRSEVIARTEALRSVHEGTREMYRQVELSGALGGGRIERTWLTAGDARVRDSHRFLDGTVRGPDEVWETSGGTLAYPGDPSAPASETVQCRCALATRIIPGPPQGAQNIPIGGDRSTFFDLRPADQIAAINALPRNERLIERAQDLFFVTPGRAGERVSNLRSALIAEGIAPRDTDRAIAQALELSQMRGEALQDRLTRLPTLADVG